MAEANSKSEARLTQNKTCQERHIKVNHTYYMHKRKDNPSGTGRRIPWIQLKGDWLQQAGFEINTPVKVRVMKGCLVLTAEQKPSQAFLAFEKLDEQRQALVLRTIDALMSKNRKY